MPWYWPCPNKLVGPFPYYSVVFGPQLVQNKQPHNSTGIPGLQSNNFSERGGRVPEYRLTQHGSYRNQQACEQGSVFPCNSLQAQDRICHRPQNSASQREVILAFISRRDAVDRVSPPSMALAPFPPRIMQMQYMKIYIELHRSQSSGLSCVHMGEQGIEL